MTREERIKAHREKIEKIITDNRNKKLKEAEEARNAATPGAQPPAAQPGAAPGAAPLPPGQAVPTGVVTPGSPGAPPVPGAVAQPIQPVQPGQPGAAPPAPGQAAAAPQGVRSEARSMMFLYPFDTTVKVGDTFVTEIAADTKHGVADRVAFTLKYPVEILNPLAIDHSPLESLADEEIEFSYDASRGEIYLAADFATRTNLEGRPVARITWEALAPTPGSSLRFVFPQDDERATGLFLAAENVLGTSAGANDGVINSTITIRTESQKTVVQKIGRNELMISPQELAPPEAAMSMSLRPSQTSVAAGDEFHVDVLLSNPRRDPFDRLSLYLQFDPDSLEVVDRDRGNSIRRGVNIQEPADEIFPFDFHRTNLADNASGIVEYVAGAESEPVKGSGIVGRVHFRALRDSAKSDIVLVRNAPGFVPTTEVSYLKHSLLVNAPAVLSPLAGASVDIVPAGPGASGTAFASPPDNGRTGRGVSLTQSGLGKHNRRM